MNPIVERRRALVEDAITGALRESDERFRLADRLVHRGRPWTRAQVFFACCDGFGRANGHGVDDERSSDDASTAACEPGGNVRLETTLRPIATALELAAAQLLVHRQLLGPPAITDDRERTATILHGDVLQSRAFEALGTASVPAGAAHNAFAILIGACRRAQEGHATLLERPEAGWDAESVAFLECRLGALTGAATGLAGTVHDVGEDRVSELTTYGTRLGSHLWVHTRRSDHPITAVLPSELGSIERIEDAATAVVDRLPETTDVDVRGRIDDLVTEWTSPCESLRSHP